MGWWLRFVGGTCIVLGVLLILLIVLSVTLAGMKASSDDPANLPEALGWIAASPFLAALYVGGLMATGAICYVGGRALQHMDRSARQPRQRVRYVERPEPRLRPPADDRPGIGDAPVRRPYRRRR